jgi:hypothetical protein
MYKDILLSIAGIDVFPVVSLVLFVAVFSIMLIRVAMMDRAGTARLAALPFDDESPGAGSACGPREESESSSAAARARGGGAPRAVMNEESR